MVAEQRARRRSRYAYQVAVQVGRRPSCEPRTANVRPFLPARPDSGSDDQAAHRPQRHVQPGAPMWPVPPHRRIPGSSTVRTARLQRLCGHRTRVRPDTPDHPGRMDSGRLDTRRPPDQLDGRPSVWRTADADQRRPPWPASGHPGRPRRRPPAGRPEPRSGCSVCGAGQSMTVPR